MLKDRAPETEADESVGARVLMVAPYYPYPIAGGIEKQAHELALAVTALGTTVIALGVKHAVSQSRVENVDGISVLRLSWSQARSLRFLRTPFDLFWTLIRERRRYDLIHVHVPSWFGLMTVVCAKLLRKPVLTKLPNVGAQGIPGMRSRPFGRVAVEILRRSDAIVAMSRESLKELSGIGFPLSRTLTTTNGISMSAAGNQRDSDMREDCVRAVFVGRLVEQKGVDVLLRAWKMVHVGATVDAVLELWGDGPQRKKLQQLADELDIRNRVVFRGHVESVGERLAEMDIFVLPSFIEGNSNSLLEAMVAGLPAVATRTGGTPMLMGAGGAPWLTEPGDVGALAEKLGALIRNLPLRQSLGKAMRAQVELHFDIRSVARTYRRAYALLAEGNAQRIWECKDSWPYATE